MPGEIIRGNRLDFQTHLASIRPDVLLLHAGPNDLRTASNSSDSARGLAPEPEPSWMHRFATYRVLARKLQLGPIPDSWVGRSIDTAQWDRIEKDLVDFVDAAQQKGLVVVMVTHAHRAEETATGSAAKRQVAEGRKLLRMDAESVIQAFARYNQLVRDIAQEKGLALIDLREAIPASSEFFGDHTHFSAEGSRRAAQAAFDVLKNLDLSPQ